MKYIFGLAVALLGFFLGVAAISFIGKPENFPISLNPVEALSDYFFSFTWAAGSLGTIIGAALLLAYLALWYYIGVRVYKVVCKA